MNHVELDDAPEALQAKETERALPLGMRLLYLGLVVWGIWYFFSYVDWDQAGELKGAVTAVGTNIGSTVFFTAAAALTAIVLAVMMARRARGKR